MLGGLTVSWMPDGTGLDRGERTVTARIDPHPDVEVVVFVPETQLATRTARAVLPATVPLAAAAAGAGRAALLVHALTADPSHLHAATRDWLHQEARRPSYPATMDLVDLLRAQGHAAVVSGAGPSVLVLTTREAAASVQAGHLARALGAADARGAAARRHGARSLTTLNHDLGAPPASRRSPGGILSPHHTPRQRRPVHHPHAEAIFSASRRVLRRRGSQTARSPGPSPARWKSPGPQTRGKDPSCQKQPPVRSLACRP